MSNYGNRKSKMPDVSPMPRSDFSVRNRTIAIMLLAAIIAAIALGIGAFCTHYDKEAQENAAAVKAKQAELLEMATKVAEKEAELSKKEAELKRRETALAAAEAALEEEKATLADEKAAFVSGQLRVFDLSRDLYRELAPYYEPVESVED